uniref:Uncharacterized protein n=1 Tax=Panagrolaimus sp. ES5 TaxID=591445 RepID=A0AC34FWP3_9BILA
MASSSSRNLILLVHDLVNMSQYHIPTSKWRDLALRGDIKNLNPADIFAQIQSATNLNKIKAIAFTIMDLSFPSLAEAYQFRLKCSSFCKSNEIQYFYIPVSSIVGFSVMSKAKVMVEEGEEVLICCPSHSSAHISSNLLIRRKGFYEVIRSHTDFDLSLSKEWKEKLLKDANPKKVIIMNLSPTDPLPFLDKCAKVFPDALVIRDESHFAIIHDAIVGKVMHLLGDKITPYDVTIQCQNRVVVFLGHDESSTSPKEIITVEYVKALPIEKSVTIDVDPSGVLTLVASSQNNTPVVFEEIRFSNYAAKKVKVTLKIDINSFHDIQVEPLHEIDEKLSKMELSDAKARFVFDKQTFTACIVKDEEKIVVTSNDLEKIPIYIAFIDKKPVIGKVAKEVYAANPKVVVFDLIKLCSITNADVMNPKWGFKIEKEDESLMVTVETVEGERRSSVEFLLALILKHGLQIIKNKTGKKMDKIEICFDGFTPNEILKKNFIEAAALIKSEIVFC